MITIGRFRIPYRVYGQEGSETLVCINGIQQSMAIWLDFVQRFSHQYRILLFDFPHQGKGCVISGPQEVSLNEQVDILDQLLTATGFNEELILCSASWGGVVAASFTIHHPKRTKKLILAGIGTKPNQRMIETITNGMKLPMENRREIAETLIESFGENLPDGVKTVITRQFERMESDTLGSFYKHGSFILASEPLQKVIDLKRITCRTILLRGEHDTIIDSDDLNLLAAEIMGAEVRTIKGAGHFLHLENDKLMDTYEDILRS